MTPTALEAVAAPRSPQTDELVSDLRRLVRQNTRRWKVVLALQAIGLAVSAPLAYLWLVFLLDNWLHLPVFGRLLASVGFLAGLTWAVFHLVRQWRSLRLTEDQVALAIERSTPGRVHNRLINAVQLAREARGGSLRQAVVEENCTTLQRIRLEQAARLRPALLCAGLAALIVGAGLAYGLLLPERLGNAAARIFNPLGDIDPLYRTRLRVTPADAALTIRIAIEGERPESLTIVRRGEDKVTTEAVAVPSRAGEVVYTFRDVTGDFSYAVSGGDFTTPFYQVTVARRAALARVRATYRYPAYTGLAARTVEGTGGDLEALDGTCAAVAFVFDRPVDRATLLLTRPGKGGSETRALARRADGREFSTEVVFENEVGYRLETVQGERPAERSPAFTLRVLRDQPPKLELIGLEQRTEVQPDSVLPLQVVASDDFGLERVGLFFRRAPMGGEKAADEGWKVAAEWAGQRKTALRTAHDLALARLNVAEGDRIELALRAIDTDPLRKGAWTTGAVYQLTVGGDGVALQLRYEQILRTEGELKALVKAEEGVLGKTADWLRKLDTGDAPKGVEALPDSVKALGAEQEGVRRVAGKTARAMVAEAGNVRVAIGLLADTEMVRVLRIFDSIPTRDNPQAKRAALADGRITQERVLRSLQDLLEQYALFRSDWELSHMIPFAKMLAERQAKMRDQSRARAGRSASSAEEFERRSMARRQDKVLALCGLIRPAFSGLADRLQDQEASLAAAFKAGAEALGAEALLKPMRQAATEAGAGRWKEAAAQQGLAADALAALHARLRQAQVDAAQKALAALKEKAKSDLAAQKELEKLTPGSADALVKDFPNDMKLEDLLRIREVAGAKKTTGKDEEPDLKNTKYDDVDRKVIELTKDSGVRQDPYTLKLGTQAEKTKLMDMYKGKDRNAVIPFIQEKFDDLVGKLLDEADELQKGYQTINLSTNRNNDDGGDVGKIGGKLNSTGAVTATGNKKPPTLESGGVARTGRQGARAYGMVADQDTYNRKGRDQALEGQQQVADQPGKNKMKDTDENQKDTSTGVGGKLIESKDTHFSLHEAGKWKDEYTKRMQKPQKKNYIVERQGDKIDAKTAALLRDLTSKQEQVIERLKAIKKELRNLYLPTEHLDEMAAALQAGYAALKERPDAELFRTQLQNLERLRGALRVFRRAGAGFQPSLPRDRVIRGRVLDEPTRPTVPGYEEAVKQYYLKLATQ